ncbi:MAG: hypothetical protein ACK5F5_09475 [Gammaproteobacteria bacterium]|jgi:hypothetical protein
MSPQENRVAAELALWGALLLFIWMRLTDGTVILGQSLGTFIVEQPPGRLLWTYVAAGAIAAIGQLIIRAVVFRKEKAAPADERERFIERKADQVAYGAGVVTVHLVIGHVLLVAFFDRSDVVALDFTSTAGILLVLLTVLLVQEIVRGVATLVLYRRT